MTVYDYLGKSLDVEHYYRHPRSYKRRGVFSIHEPSPTIRGVNRPIPKGYYKHDGDPVQIDEKVRPLKTRFENQAVININVGGIITPPYKIFLYFYSIKQ